MSNIIPFDFNGFEVRVFQDQNDDPWFVLTDICNAMDLSNPSSVAQRLDEDERSKLNLGRQGEAVIISESGFYSVVMRSDKPEAKKFSKWVRSEVLPSIRKTGNYALNPMPDMGSIKPVIEANKLFKSNLSVTKLLFKGNDALIAANNATARATGVNVFETLGVIGIESDKQDTDLVPSDIGEVFGVSAIRINRVLENAGLQESYRDSKKRLCWKLTEEGEKHAHYIDTNKLHSDGSPVKQIKWYSSIVDYLVDNEYFKKGEAS